MAGTIEQLLQSSVGIGVMALMGLVMFTFFLWYGFFAIALPSASAISFVRDAVARKRASAGATCEERIAVLNPQLGLTMADGGDSLDKNEKE
jgi:hypothetical protein